LSNADKGAVGFIPAQELAILTACYSIEGCLSDRCVLSQERIGYMVENIHQLNLLSRSPLTHSRESHLQPQELLR